MIRTVAVLVFLVIGVALRPAPVMGQWACSTIDDFGCQFEPGPAGGHKAPHTMGPRLGVHVGCLLCFMGDQVVEGEYCHEPCPYIAIGADRSEKYRDALAAADRGDALRVVSYLTELPDHILINRFRKSVQIKSCNGDRIIANIPLETEVLAAVSMNQVW